MKKTTVDDATYFLRLLEDRSGAASQRALQERGGFCQVGCSCSSQNGTIFAVSQHPKFHNTVVEDLKKLNKNKKMVKKLADSFDAFLASQVLIPQIPRLLGPGLNKARFSSAGNRRTALTFFRLKLNRPASSQPWCSTVTTLRPRPEKGTAPEHSGKKHPVIFS